MTLAKDDKEDFIQEGEVWASQNWKPQLLHRGGSQGQTLEA